MPISAANPLELTRPPSHARTQPRTTAAVLAAIDSIAPPAVDSSDSPLWGWITDLTRAGVPVIAWSRKTRAEIERFRARFHLTGPFISEAGAALFIPDDYFRFMPPSTRRIPGYHVLEFGIRTGEVLSTLRRVAAAMNVGITALSEMTIEETARQFSVSLFEARLMKLREYGELFALEHAHPTRRGRFVRALGGAGLCCEYSALFDPYEQVTSVSDRTLAIQAVDGLLRGARGRTLMVGMASRREDLPVLTASDVPVVLRHGQPQETDYLLRQVPNAALIEPSDRRWPEAFSQYGLAATAAGKNAGDAFTSPGAR